MAPMPSEEEDHPHLAEGGRVCVRGRARVCECVSEPEWERVLVVSATGVPRLHENATS